MMGKKERHFAPLTNVSLEELVPHDSFYRHVEGTLDLSFVRKFVHETLAALVAPAEAMENQPMLDLVFRICFRWKLRPRQVTGDRKYGTEENIVALERRHIRAYLALPDPDHRTPFFSSDRFCLLMSLLWTFSTRWGCYKQHGRLLRMC